MIPPALESDAASNHQDFTPRATTLLQQAHEAEGRAPDIATKKSLRAMCCALAVIRHCGEDLTVVGEREYARRLAIIVESLP